MKLALIPPQAHLVDASRTGYHLLLPQHTDEKAYRAFYRWRRAEGDFLMLDNGVAEGVEVSGARLMEIGREYGVHEIVMPDVLMDMNATLDASYQFSREFADEEPWFNYVGVVQGTTLEELKTCASKLSTLTCVRTLAIPRHVETTIGIGTRFMIACYIRECFDCNIHLLGTNPEYITELIQYGSEYRRLGIRGIDTASPYYYTMDDKHLVHGGVARRPDDYYARVVHDKFALLQENIAVMKEWVYGY